MDTSSSVAMKSSTEMSCKYNEGSHLKPPTKSTRKARGGPAETGHLTPRSRTTSNTSCISTPGLASSPSSSSAAAVGLASSPSPTILERSRSSGRLVVPCAAEASSGSSLKRGSAASTSALASCSSAATTPSAGGGATSASVGHLLPPPPQRNGGTINTINKCSANVSGGSVIPSSGQQQVTNPKKTKRILLQWKHKASMSKLGKGTRSLLGKWKSHSQSVDGASVQQHHQKAGSTGINSDSLDTGLGHIASDPGTLESHSFGSSAEKSANGSVVHHANDHRKASKVSKNASQSKQPTIEEPKAKASWSEHVWTAWVHRGFSDDVTELVTLQPGGDLLTDFQKDKFRYFFNHVLDMNGDMVISWEDFEKLNERMRHYMDWSVNSVQYLALKELHETFLDCFLTTASNFVKKDEGDTTRNPEQMFENWKLGFPIGSVQPHSINNVHNYYRFDFWDPFKRLDALYDKMEHITLNDVFNADASPKEMKTCISMEEWIDVWGTIVGKAKRMDDFPMWLQYYPKVLFAIINRSGTGIITKSELKLFYTAFMDVGKLGDTKLDQFTDNAYQALTSNGDFELTFHIYRLSFLNFLLGKQPNGPGQYLFGTVTPQTPTCMFPIDYSAMNSTEEDLEPFRPDKLDKSSRRSVLV